MRRVMETVRDISDSGREFYHKFGDYALFLSGGVCLSQVNSPLLFVGAGLVYAGLKHARRQDPCFKLRTDQCMPAAHLRTRRNGYAVVGGLFAASALAGHDFATILSVFCLALSYGRTEVLAEAKTSLEPCLSCTDHKRFS